MLARIPLLQVFGYGAFFMAAFTLFAYWSFPYERAVQFYLSKMAADSGTRVTVEDVDPYWLTGVEVKNVHVYTSSGDAPPLHVTEGRARVSLMTALGQEMAAAFDIDLPTGGLEGDFSKSDEALVVHTKLRNVRLEMFPMLASVTAGLPLSGTANGVIDVTLHDQPDQSQGTVHLEVADLRIGDGEAKLSIPGVPALTVDPVDAGALKLVIQIGEGRAVVEAIEARGEDLELSGDGEIRLGKTLATSRPSVGLTARFTDAYKKKTPRTEAMFMLLEGSNAPQLKRAKGPDGSYSFQLTGSLAAPRFVPGGRRAAPGARRGNPRLRRGK